MSKVYFTDFRTTEDRSLLDKLEALVKKAGIGTIDFNKKFVAIKIHFGELGNMAFLRPQWAKRIADIVKAAGGKPFLTDCGTLYVGCRKDALEHLATAAENGFSPLSTGCQIIIADGLKGTDETVVPTPGMKHIKEAKIGHAIMDADIVISLNHFKGHEMAGFGGAIKNLGMGSGSRAGKMAQHTSGKPRVVPDKCKRCRQCVKVCANGAIAYDEDGVAHIDQAKCVGCGRCFGWCNFDAIEHGSWDANDMLNEKMAEYALAVVKGRPNFHINIINQVSPKCDCYGANDAPIIPDVGMLASFDPVALDAASADLCNAAPVVKGSCIDGIQDKDHFHACGGGTNWRTQIEHGEKIGLGESKYELVKV